MEQAELQLETAINAYIATIPTPQLILFISFMFLVLALKGFALWTAAQKSDKGWFIALLFLNTLGILEIVYLLFFSKRDTTKAKSE